MKSITEASVIPKNEQYSPEIMSYVFLNMWVSRQWQNSHFCLNYPFNYRDRNRCLPILEAVIHNATLLKCVISSHPLQIPPTLTSCLSDFNNCYCSISVLFSLLLFWKHCACLASIIACQIPHYLKSCNVVYGGSLRYTRTSLSSSLFFLLLCFHLFEAFRSDAVCL